MAVSYATTGPSIATGEIKWSTLRRSFKTITLRENFSDSDSFALDNNTIAISASELLRDTDTTKSEDPIVGDATENAAVATSCLLYTSPSPRDQRGSRMPSSA